MSGDEIRAALAELARELETRGHGTAPVPNSPVDMLNVWLDDEGRVPAAAVVLGHNLAGVADVDEWAWGHAWQHVHPGETPAVEIAELVEQTMREAASS